MLNKPTENIFLNYTTIWPLICYTYTIKVYSMKEIRKTNICYIKGTVSGRVQPIGNDTGIRVTNFLCDISMPGGIVPKVLNESNFKEYGNKIISEHEFHKELLAAIKIYQEYITNELLNL